MPKTPTVKKPANPARKPAAKRAPAAKKAAVKKVPVKKTVATKAPDSERNLTEIFARLRAALAKYTPPYHVTLDRAGRYELWSKKAVVVDGRPRKEMFFAGLIVQKDYVGLYYMPIYAETKLTKVFSPRFLKLLKGKSCFHVKTLEGGLYDDAVAALKTGHDLYVQRGWV